MRFIIRGRKGQEWEMTIERDIADRVAARPTDVTLKIPAAQTELGKRLELASRLMRSHGYRLRQVVPDSGTTWSASYMRVEE